jgi:hypothetical protein
VMRSGMGADQIITQAILKVRYQSLSFIIYFKYIYIYIYTKSAEQTAGRFWAVLCQWMLVGWLFPN